MSLSYAENLVKRRKLLKNNNQRRTRRKKKQLLQGQFNCSQDSRQWFNCSYKLSGEWNLWNFLVSLSEVILLETILSFLLLISSCDTLLLIKTPISGYPSGCSMGCCLCLYLWIKPIRSSNWLCWILIFNIHLPFVTERPEPWCVCWWMCVWLDTN